MNKKHDNVDAYIADFPSSTQTVLENMRSIIKQTVPQATELISYNIPAYKLAGFLVYFAGYNHHVGFYPGAAVIAHFTLKLTAYKLSKGTVQFPLTHPLPKELIVNMIEFKANEIAMKQYAKAKK